MSDWPDTKMNALSVITPWHEESLGQVISTQSAAGAIASGTLTQNNAYYYPFQLDREETAVKMFFMVGATQNGNIDLGIYDHQFNALVTLGATAMGVANTLQEGDITNTVLPPGRYWMACSISSATGTAFRYNPADELALPNWPALEQASAHPLPTGSATPVRSTNTAPPLVVMGVAFDTLI